MTPVSKVWIHQAFFGARAQHRFFTEVSDVEGNDLDEDSDHIDRLARDEYKKCGVVAHAYTAIDPWAVVVVALNAFLTHITVIAPRQHHDLALEAELVDGEPLQ